MPFRNLAAALPVLCAAASLSMMPPTHAQAETDAATVTVKPYGKTPGGEQVQLYTLTNRTGMRVTIATYGATVINLYAPDRKHRLGDVALGFGSIQPYFTKSPYFGAIIGRYGNRIANGRFTLEGKVYQLTKNNGPNTLHGGAKGFDKRMWTGEIVSQDPPAVRFSRTSPDGEEHFPGTLKVAVTYTLTNADELKLQYWAQTDRTTVLNLTHHTYFNLAGAGSGDVLAHELRIHASHFTPVNKSLIPTGEIKPVAGTPMDFRTFMPMGSRLKEVGGTPVGYDHNYVLDKGLAMRPALAAEVREPKTGRMMKVYTDQPGIQFYTGNFLDGTLRGKGGKVYRQYTGFCLETQHFPNSPNEPKFPSTVLKPGETFRSTTIYKFSAK